MDLYTALSRVRLLVSIKQFADQMELRLFRFLQIAQKNIRKIVPQQREKGLDFAILCVKRPEYIKMAIQNINSLHYYNPYHTVTLYVDPVCQKAFARSTYRIDYPKLIRTKLLEVSPDKPWQISKVETLIDASLHNRILTDADGIWRGDPKVSSQKITFLVEAYPFSRNNQELALLKKVFPKEDVSDLLHYVTGFVSIPKKFMTYALQKECKDVVCKIIDASTMLSIPLEEKVAIKRLAEEIGLSVAVQLHTKRENIATLKESDGPGSRHILQSLYYGCSHKISQ